MEDSGYAGWSRNVILGIIQNLHELFNRKCGVGGEKINTEPIAIG